MGIFRATVAVLELQYLYKTCTQPLFHLVYQSAALSGTAPLLSPAVH